MDLKKLRGVLDSPGEPLNGTATNLTELPSNILEAFIPGYSLISRFIFDAFGFDIGVLVSIGLLAFAIVTSVTYTWSKAFSLFQDCWMSNVYIDDSDDLYDSVLEWIADQRMSKVSRSIKAVTRYGMSNIESEEATDGAMDEQGIFNYGKWSAKIPPRDEELIKLSCIGRSTLPIKSLLDHIKFWSIDKETAMTVIRRPASKDRSRYAGAWDRLRAKPSRPMDTVALDPAQKEKIIADINEYLHPSSPRWYATRGIPYRRGYLFHGPPGVGKTSLAYALAGIFGLDIYNISLLEPTLTESDLNRLFNNLPQRCIVLLEDIDSAGLLRDEKSDQAEAADPNKKKEEFSAETLAKALTTANRKQKQADDNKQGISLSGLLNAIDGVATHEGRVLVMTTNHPEKLDDALIRPGRVDMQVEFSLATHEQMRDIFIRMYSPDEESQPTQTVRRRLINNAHSKPGLNGAAKAPVNEKVIPKLPMSTTLPALSKDELCRMAEKFMGHMPEGKLSPAEVQNFLLTRKKEPERALEEVGGWCKALLEAKEKKEKVVRVQ
ncbi:putative bcs1-like atpase [Diplodia seriata]|uniref:Putative bcs1-like atpase n=1 Tax=Diplodia seriata TaxID=420778 RepID=A0A0G2GF28_9PEZI|nr:putative bcs1-like atpase [Diplodia seriata]